mgnify:FL=1|jgi:hypothetical protein
MRPYLINSEPVAIFSSRDHISSEKLDQALTKYQVGYKASYLTSSIGTQLMLESYKENFSTLSGLEVN